MRFIFLNAGLLLFATVMMIFACGRGEKKKPEPMTEVPTFVPEFNSDSAYAFIKQQCDFGPRVPNTQAHKDCGDYYIRQMSAWCDTVIVQAGTVTAFDGTILNFRNIISSFNPENSRRILLFAHWDTRPWADQDAVDKDKPNIGADDGASGVAVLMEIARVLSQNRLPVGIDFIFFDAEDWGKSGGGLGAEDSYALGTQYWIKNLHVKNYTAEYGILLDLVGAKGARFLREGNSKQHANFLVDEVWNTANRLGYGNYFPYEDGGWITDDHFYVNKINIPSIDIIYTIPGSSNGFPPHWHTHKDNMDIIDPNTLKAVGQTVLTVLFSTENS